MRKDTAQKSILRLKAGGRENYFFEIQEAESCVLSHPEPHGRNRFFLLRAEETFLNPLRIGTDGPGSALFSA